MLLNSSPITPPFVIKSFNLSSQNIEYFSKDYISDHYGMVKEVKFIKIFKISMRRILYQRGIKHLYCIPKPNMIHTIFFILCKRDITRFYFFDLMTLHLNIRIL